jgi:hypothetical protein
MGSVDVRSRQCARQRVAAGGAWTSRLVVFCVDRGHAAGDTATFVHAGPSPRTFCLAGFGNTVGLLIPADGIRDGKIASFQQVSDIADGPTPNSEALVILGLVFFPCRAFFLVSLIAFLVEWGRDLDHVAFWTHRNTYMVSARMLSQQVRTEYIYSTHQLRVEPAVPTNAMFFSP